MNEKTPGTIAYEAYAGEIGWVNPTTREIMQPFHFLSPREREAWERAAKAVLTSEMEVILGDEG